MKLTSLIPLTLIGAALYYLTAWKLNEYSILQWPDEIKIAVVVVWVMFSSVTVLRKPTPQERERRVNGDRRKTDRRNRK